MITISDILSPKNIIFDLGGDNNVQAVARVSELLRKDPRVNDWGQFVAGLEKGTSCMAKENGSTLCIAHARTTAVNAMTMAVGRSLEKVEATVEPAASQGGTKLRLVFVIGVPAALASDYLRIIGALARIFHTEKGEAALAQAATAADFLATLRQLEIAL